MIQKKKKQKNTAHPLPPHPSLCKDKNDGYPASCPIGLLSPPTIPATIEIWTLPLTFQIPRREHLACQAGLGFCP